MNNRACVFGAGSLYRLSLYNLMAKDLDCDFYLCQFPGDIAKGIKEYDYNQLKNFKGTIREKSLVGKFFWSIDTIKLINKPYKYYLVGGAYDISAWILLILSKFTNKKVISWSHGMYGREKGLRRLIKTLFYKLCYRNVVYNQHAKSLMIKEGINSNNIFVVYNSLNHDEQLQYRNNITDIYKKHFNNDYPTLIFIGRLIADKKLDMILSVMMEMKDKGVICNCAFIGDGPIRNDLEIQSESLGLKDNIWFYGESYSEKENSELISSADLCVIPGATGLTAIHSLTYGTPVITHDDFSHQGPEFESIIEGKTGSFFKNNNKNSLVDRIMNWITIKSERDNIRQSCYREVDTKWVAEYQVGVFRNILNVK